MAPVELSAGDLTARFLRDVGMLGVSLQHQATEFVALPGGIDGYRAGHVTGVPLLAPWANRLSQRQYTAAGQTVDLTGLPLHDDGRGLPIHGTMTAQPGWEVVERTGAKLGARFDFGARPDLLASFPLPHELHVDAEVDGTSLVVTTTLRPTAERPVPVSFGWHPYFHLPAGPRSSWQLTLPACEHVVLDERGIPSGAREPQPAATAPLGDRSLDDLYALGDDRRLGLVGGDASVTVEFDEHYPFAQVFSPADKEFACLEPMTAPTNALVDGTCPLVEPGASFSARFAVTARFRR